MTIISTSNHCKENKLPGGETFRKKKETENGGGGCWIREEEVTGRGGGFTGGSSLSLRLAEIPSSNILGPSPKRPCCLRMRGAFLLAQSHYFLDRLRSFLSASCGPPPVMRLLPCSIPPFWDSTIEELAGISITENSFWDPQHPSLSSPSPFPMGPQ